MSNAKANAKATMVITEEYVNSLRTNGLLERQDIRKITELTKENGLQAGRGYTGTMVRNYLFYQFPCTIEVYSIIISYFEEKLELRLRLQQRAKAMIDSVEPVKMTA